MANDLVERLQTGVDYANGRARALMREAAAGLRAAEAEIDRLTKALRFYAQDRYQYEDGGSVEEDKGEIARAALEPNQCQ